MSTVAATLQTGVNAVTQGRFSDAIEILEGLCHGQLRPPSKAYYQARMWLIRAYQGSGQLPQAIKLCRQLATSSHPQVQQWAQKTLLALRNPASVSSSSALTLPEPTHAERSSSSQTSLSPSSKRLASTRSEPSQATMRQRSTDHQAGSHRLLNQIEADKHLHCGIQAIRRQKFPEAVKSLEAFVCGVAATHANINYAQTSLVKAYMGNGQSDLALQLARKLLKSENAGTQTWAERFIETHDPRKSDRQAPASTKQAVTSPVIVDERAQQTTSANKPKIKVSISPVSRRTTDNPQRSTLILSATCYGSFYAGPILSLISPFDNTTVFSSEFSMVALMRAATFVFCSWITPIVVAVIVLALSQDRLVKANAQEAINFWITAVCLGLLVGLVGGLFFVLSRFLFPPLVLLIGILLLILGMVFYIAPLVGLIMCLVKPHESFRFPFIWHILGS